MNKLKLTVTHGDQSMTIEADPDAEGAVINSRVIAIDQEDMYAYAEDRLVRPTLIGRIGAATSLESGSLS